MQQISFPDRYREEFSKLDWIVRLGKHESQIMEPLGEWFRRGGYSISDITPGLRNEIFFKDLKSGISHPNFLWREWGYDAEHMDGGAWLDALHPDDREMMSESFANYRTGNNRYGNQAVFRVADVRGLYHWVLSSSVQVRRNSLGELHQYVGRDIEIGSRIEREAALKEHARYAEDTALRDRALVEAAGEIAGVSDAASLQFAVNKAARSIMCLDDFRLISVGSHRCIKLLGPDLPDWLDTYSLRKAMGSPSCTVFTGTDKYNKAKKLLAWPLGEILDGYALALMRPLEKCSSETTRLMDFLSPLILRAWQQVERLAELQRYAATDPLTGTWNRRGFLQLASTELRNDNKSSCPSTIAMLDIDHFKRVNDKYGHDFGDRILKAVAEGLSETLRAGDILCRWGGEEFAVFLKDTTTEAAQLIIERIRDAASEYSNSCKCRVTLSAGFHTIHHLSPRSLNAAIDLADKALYEAKRRGRNCSVYQNDSDLILPGHSRAL